MLLPKKQTNKQNTKKKTAKALIEPDFPFITRLRSFITIYIKGLLLFTPKQISTAQKRHCQIKWNTTSVTDRAPLLLYPIWEVCKAQGAFQYAKHVFEWQKWKSTHNGVYVAAISWAKLPLFGRFNLYLLQSLLPFLCVLLKVKKLVHRCQIDRIKPSEELSYSFCPDADIMLEAA